MDLLVVTGARFDAGKVTALKVGRYHIDTQVWITEPQEVAVIELVKTIESGRRAFTMLEKQGRCLPGQELHIIHNGAGQLTVAPVAVKPGCMLEDLPSF